MRYPNYVWIVHNWYNLDWWRQDNSGCTEFELMDMLNMQLIIDHYPRIDEADMNKPNIGNIVSINISATCSYKLVLPPFNICSDNITIITINILFNS